MRGGELLEQGAEDGELGLEGLGVGGAEGGAVGGELRGGDAGAVEGGDADAFAGHDGCCWRRTMMMDVGCGGAVVVEEGKERDGLGIRGEERRAEQRNKEKLCA